MSDVLETSSKEWVASKSSHSNAHEIIVKIEKYITKAKTFKQADQLLCDLQNLKQLTKTLQGQPLQWITK